MENSHMNSLSYKSFDKSTIIPRRISREKGKTGKIFFMGAFDMNDAPIVDSLLFREIRGIDTQIGRPGQLTAQREHSPGTAIYMGILFHHFGHFILEGLSRAWFAKQNPSLPIAWVVDEKAPRGGGYTTWQRDMLSLLGIVNLPIFVAKATVFDRVIIPDAGYKIQTFMHPEQRDFLATVEHRPEMGRYTWLSRAKLREVGNRSAAMLDKRLTQAGWHVVYPEQLSLAEQVRAIAQSERLAGEQGSALHPLVFLKNITKLRVDIFDRSPDLILKAQNKNYATIAQSKGIDQKIHRCDFEKIIKRVGISVDKIARNSYDYLDAMDLPRAAHKNHASHRNHPAPVGSYAGKIAKIAKAEKYLEVGLSERMAFLEADVQCKHVVDGEFQFDTREYDADHAKFFEMTGDSFFLYFADTKDKYDLIVLSGLNRFERTLRDFCGTQAHCHDRTVWLIDDVSREDMVSAPADLAQECRAPRGAPGGAWRGDGLKALFAIHDLFPSLSHRTFVAGGTVRAVILRRPRAEFSPGFDSLEKISQLTASNFPEHQELLNMSSEEETLAWLAR